MDISNPPHRASPGELRCPVVQTSRLTRGNGKEALYVVANDWNNTGSTTKVKSFRRVDGQRLQAKTDIDLGGYVSDIQATGERLMVARWDWIKQPGSQVSVIDLRARTER
ncbi:MAG: hypothetical protein R3E66_21625 [bacterium]